MAASTDFNTCDKAYSVSKSFIGHHLNGGHKPDILLAGTCQIRFILYLERKSAVLKQAKKKQTNKKQKKHSNQGLPPNFTSNFG